MILAKKSDQYPIVEVTWIDAEEHGEVGWNEIKEQLAYAKKPCPVMKSVGYMVFSNENHISLLSTIGVKECSTLEKIPRGFIRDIRMVTGKKSIKETDNDANL